MSTFSSLNDSAEYNNKQVFFYKRAQLLLSDVYHLFPNEEWAKFENTCELTACADYKLSQLLRKLGVLSYTKELAKKIDNGKEISAKSVEEIEIRANTIWAVEYIRQRSFEKLLPVSATDINDYLWLATQRKYFDDKPYHLTRTTAY